MESCYIYKANVFYSFIAKFQKLFDNLVQYESVFVEFLSVILIFDSHKLHLVSLITVIFFKPSVLAKITSKTLLSHSYILTDIPLFFLLSYQFSTYDLARIILLRVFKCSSGFLLKSNWTMFFAILCQTVI